MRRVWLMNLRTCCASLWRRPITYLNIAGTGTLHELFYTGTLFTVLDRLFVHFVEVLGPRDFLAPVCQLLLDKVAVRYMKSKDIALLELPAGVMAAFPANMQTSVSIT